jgi:hypothetical protein
MCRDTTENNKISLYLNEHGIKLNKSLLWLDSFYDGPFSFISSADNFKVPGANTQLIMSEETHSLVKTKYRLKKILRCQFNRPFSLGDLTLELLPAGTMPGAANLLISINKQKIFYGASFQTEKIPHTRSMQTNPAQIFILKVSNPVKNQQPYSRKNEQKKLLNILSQPSYTKSLILCNPLSVNEILHLLVQHNFNVIIHPSFSKILRPYKECGFSLGKYSVFNNNNFKDLNSVLLIPRKFRAHKQLLKLMNRPQIIIEDSLEQYPCSVLEQKIFLPKSAQHLELLKITKDINPSQIYTFGPYAHHLADKINLPNSKIMSLFPKNNLPLF